ncbi:type I inositol polyphosphate 5-phosphatase 10-like [Neltuma alba]|uniref:type I inositol polyphosphate 5-phosphatase 10-like n=1 Tax=Neltuma alba TaxID=207710 RepID=UPI0010A4C2D4|nr:type I inositol polyphosphate 5-phosphatase 10-like [Prosopis alba]XP_028802682.1 type I inositol polyphosphate 5-phosphatase 10-like [Prosopis alba]
MENDGDHGSEVSDIIPTNQQRTKQSFIRKIFTMKERNEREASGVSVDTLEALSDPSIGSHYFSCTEPPMSSGEEIQNLRVFVATWNVGGQCPDGNLDLSDFLQVRNEPDIYVLGFQEIVPLNAGNVLVLEDNEPAAKWLALINHSLNRPSHLASKGLKHTASFGGSLFFQKPTYRKLKKTLRTLDGKRLKGCNCVLEMERKVSKEFCFLCQESNVNLDDSSSEEDDDSYQTSISLPTNANMKYSLVASKQMVGIFVCVWMKKELVQHVGHLRVCCTSRGIMGCLGNKGCISVSLSLYQTTFCFICSHLASGEKEGDELRRNLDVIEILKNTQFARICKTSYTRMPERILDHDRIIWLGDLNYRIALSYDDAKRLVERKDWLALFDKDQLQTERETGRVFKGWKEGKIYFAPTYKYLFNSDSYYAESVKVSKSKRRTPAWCDRILWRGRGIQQRSYERKELKFSDHRPVCATFVVQVGAMSGRFKKKAPSFNFQIEDLVTTTRRAYFS